MPNADTAKRLIEGDPDSPESFDVKGHLMSPVTRLAKTNGFVRSDRNDQEERWVKKLSNGQEAWLRSRAQNSWNKSVEIDMRNLRDHGGRDWEFVLVDPAKGTTNTLARASEAAMSIFLGALLQRLATWPKGLPKPKLPKRRIKEAEAIDVPDPDDPEMYIRHHIDAITPKIPAYSKLARFMRETGLCISGSVSRHNHHYVHQHSTHFELEVLDIPPEHEAEIEALANEAEKIIQDKIVDINDKIYRALNSQWDFMLSDEQADATILDNEYEFNEEGKREDGGGYHLNQLDDTAKERARNWWREGAGDYEWWDYIDSEWKEELKDMGFSGVEISFSGFSSQGDGASFTAKSFDFLKWVKWWLSNEPTEKGHPYTDDL